MPVKNDNQNTISSLKGEERVRKKPAVIFGSDGIEGCEHSFFEILSNSLDEAREGHGNVINVTFYSDKSIKVEDFGRGIPLDWNEKEQKFNWELVFCELYAGGKYLNDEGGAYQYSLGTNGLGACATQYASEYMNVISYNGVSKYSISFKKGIVASKLLIEPADSKRTGTIITWKPDLEVFTDIDIKHDYIKDVLRRQSVINAGIKITLAWQTESGSFDKNEYLYKDGVIEYIRENVGVNYINDVAEFSAERTGKDRDDKKDYKLKIHYAFCFSNEVNMIEYYHNSSWLEHGGSPDKATRSAFVFAIDKWLKNNNKYTKNEAKISFSDIEDSLCLVTNCLSTYASYANQNKKAVTNVFITDAMTEYFKHTLEVYFAEKPAEAEKICNQVLINKRSREAADVMRLQQKKKLTTTLDINNTVEKFVNCRLKDSSICELYIVEGDSALSSVKLARNADFQAIIPVRGKTINCLKHTYEKIFNNEILMDLLKVIGCGIEIKTKSNKNFTAFEMDKLRWEKIVICTDADEDGYQIRALILTMLYKLLPTLIREGRIYIAETPLYEITTKEKIYFAYSENEKNAILNQIGSVKVTIQRSKGLAENDPEMMAKTTMNPATRKLIKIKMEDEQSAYDMFDVLLGDNIAARKQYIADHGHEYIALADY